MKVICSDLYIYYAKKYSEPRVLSITKREKKNKNLNDGQIPVLSKTHLQSYF